MNTAPDPKMEKKISRIISKLDNEQMMALLHGRTGMTFGKIPEQGVPEVRCADGPQGIRMENGTFTTALPCGMALAATWDPAAAEEFGGVIAREAKALDIQVSLGPGVNLMRSPLCGRNFEYYGEDPVLAGKIGAGYVRGCQARGVAATPKHLALNNQEQCRTLASSNCSRKTLRELYLEAFEIIIKEARPWAMMSSYNRINGVYASQCGETQQKFAKDECGFDGVMMSDWGGTHAAMEALRGGLDLEMGGNDGNWMYVTLWRQMIETRSITRQELEDHVRRVLRLAFRTMEAKPENPEPGEIATERHAAIARNIGVESSVLLKNQGGILPLDLKKYHRILVCGPSADYRHCIGGLIYCGGSGAVHPKYEVSALEAIRERWGKTCEILYAPGELFDGASLLPDAAVRECRCDFFEDGKALADGKAPFFSETPNSLSLRWGVAEAAGFDAGAEAIRQRAFAVRMQAKFQVEGNRPGNYGLYLAGLWEITFKVNGKEVFARKDRLHEALRFQAESGPDGLCSVELTASRRMVNNVAGGCELRVLKEPDRAALKKEVLAKAKESDLVIYVGGNNHYWDKEGIGSDGLKDIPEYAPIGGQSKLIAALAKANPNMVVALINGSALEVEPWIDRVPAVAEFWYPGQETGRVIADVLSGEASPGGRLPFTWGKRLEDYACHGNNTFYFDVDAWWPQVEYKEGIFIGYRHFDRAGIEPRFPFGYGLSYTTFDCKAKAPAVSGSVGDQSVAVTLKGTVKNTGSRAGSEVLQLYVAHPDCKREVRPVKVLRNFAKVMLKPGESKPFALDLKWRDFAFFDEAEDGFVAEPGNYTLLLARNARDIIAEFPIELK